MKATAIAHPNIAFTKYWGNKNSELNIPANNSISMNLSCCKTRTTVQFSKKFTKDEIAIGGIPIERKEGIRNPYIILDYVRKLAGKNYKAKVISENNFPTKAGIASSASGGAALALAASKAIGLELSEEETGKTARLFSGSACRSVPGGFVECYTGNNHEDSFAKTIAPADHWDLLDIVAMISYREKKVGSDRGHKLAETSPLYKGRIKDVETRNELVRKAIKERDIKTLGEICEEDCLAMHAVMITSKPPLFYFNNDTIYLLDEIIKWREEGIEAYYTIDAGPNVHIITPSRYKKEILNKFRLLHEGDFYKIPSAIRNSYASVNMPGGPARTIDEHLF